MKKLLIGTLCCLGLLLTVNSLGVDLAVNDKPAITSIGNGKAI